AGAPQLASAAPTVTRAKFTFIGGSEFGPYALDVYTRGFGNHEIRLCVSGTCVRLGVPSRHESVVDTLFRQSWKRGQSRLVRVGARLALLGDTLELRHGPARDALARAEPVMRALGDALGPGGEVLVVAGNHDHAIAAGWLDWRGRRDAPEPLGFEERVAPQYAS